jgi:hypothetical protein
LARHGQRGVLFICLKADMIDAEPLLLQSVFIQPQPPPLLPA